VLRVGGPAVGRPKRRKGDRPDRVEVLARRLPTELRSFKPWLYSRDGDPTGLRDYWQAVIDFIDGELGPNPVTGESRGQTIAARVMAAAGLTPADWYRKMLS
jgi:hypothetical protein